MRNLLLQSFHIWHEMPEWVKVLLILVLGTPTALIVSLACGMHITTP